MSMQTTNASMKEFGAKVKKEWAKMTDDDLGFLEANREEFFARLEKKEGIRRDEAEKRLKELKQAA